MAEMVEFLGHLYENRTGKDLSKVYRCRDCGHENVGTNLLPVIREVLEWTDETKTDVRGTGVFVLGNLVCPRDRGQMEEVC